MLDIAHRGIYILSIAFFITVGFILIAIGDPQYVEPIVSEEVFKAMFPGDNPPVNKLFVYSGSLIVLFSFIVGIIGAMCCRFTKKDSVPTTIDVLRAQDNSVFLIDGNLYKSNKASFYNLEDLGRLRVTSLKNLFSVELKRVLTIAPKSGDVIIELNDEAKQ